MATENCPLVRAWRNTSNRRRIFSKRSSQAIPMRCVGSGDTIHDLSGRPDTNDRNKVTDSTLRRAKLSVADAQFIIARQHQFENWRRLEKHIEALNQKGSLVSQFEAAVDAIVTGDITTLKRLLRENPELIRARSTREHRATLLHYVGANAVEGYRQKTPKNAVKIAEVLLKAGAEVDADLDYGPTAKALPRAARVQRLWAWSRRVAIRPLRACKFRCSTSC